MIKVKIADLYTYLCPQYCRVLDIIIAFHPSKGWKPEFELRDSDHLALMLVPLPCSNDGHEYYSSVNYVFLISSQGLWAQRSCVTYSNLFWQSRNATPVPESSKPVFFLLHLLKTQSLLSCFLQKLSEGRKGPRGVARGMGRGNIITEAWKLL